MNKYLKQQRGFTIVELLVVIVVIAILAAITIVAYAGITAKTQNDVTVNAVAEYAKVFENYATNNGDYPNVQYVCLGPIGTNCANMTNGTVNQLCNYVGAMSANTTLDSALKTEVASLPGPSTQQMACSSVPAGGTAGSINVAGAWYDYAPNGSPARPATIVYYLNGSQTCAKSLGGMSFNYSFTAGSTTACYMFLPAHS